MTNEDNSTFGAKAQKLWHFVEQLADTRPKTVWGLCAFVSLSLGLMLAFNFAKEAWKELILNMPPR